MTLKEAGPDYCRLHHGIREEDEDFCDFVEPCAPCGGTGGVARMGDGDDQTCGDCRGTGMEACDLTPLLYEDGKGAR